MIRGEATVMKWMSCGGKERRKEAELRGGIPQSEAAAVC